MTIGAWIFISFENTIIGHTGGIGTYVERMIRELRIHDPDLPVYWLATSWRPPRGSPYLEVLEPFEAAPVRYMFWGHDHDEPEAVLLPIVKDLVRYLECQVEGHILIEVELSFGRTVHLLTHYEGHPRVATIVRVHGSRTRFVVYNGLSKNAHLDLLYREAKMLQAARIISACSGHIRDFVAAHVNDRACAALVHLNPIDAQVFKETAGARARGYEIVNRAATQQISTTTFNIVSIGALGLIKGHQFILSAFAFILHEIPEARLIVVGSFSEQSPTDWLTRYVPQPFHEYITFTDHVDYRDMPAVIDAADVCATLYTMDTCPNAVVEVAMRERPLIALSRGGVPELLESADGEKLYYDAGDSEDMEVVVPRLIGLVMKIHDMPAERLADNARRLKAVCLDRLDPAKIVSAMIASYVRALSS